MSCDHTWNTVHLCTVFTVVESQSKVSEIQSSTPDKTGNELRLWYNYDFRGGSERVVSLSLSSHVRVTILGFEHWVVILLDWTFVCSY